MCGFQRRNKGIGLLEAINHRLQPIITLPWCRKMQHKKRLRLDMKYPNIRFYGADFSSYNAEIYSFPAEDWSPILNQKRFRLVRRHAALKIGAIKR